MKSYVPTPAPVKKYAIVKRDTGEYLSLTRRDNPLETAEFSDKGYIIHLSEYQWTHTIWIRWLDKNGYLTRLPSLAKEPRRFKLLRAVPQVDVVEIEINATKVYQLGDDPNDYPHRSGS